MLTNQNKTIRIRALYILKLLYPGYFADALWIDCSKLKKKKSNRDTRHLKIATYQGAPRKEQ